MKKYWLMIIFVIILGISILFWYFDYQLPKTTPTPNNAEKVIEKATKTEEKTDQNIKSIPLEKPPFIKD